jgi:hypothetical protein
MKTIRLAVAIAFLPLVFLFTAQAGAGPTRPADRSHPDPEQADRDEPSVPAQAHVHGKYRQLLRVLYLPDDVHSYNQFTDWGPWNGAEWGGYKNLPAGYWVYVYPRWYIWKELAPMQAGKAN